MTGLIRWIKGYVRIRVWGYSPERFMNLCTNAGILLWDISGFEQYYEMNISVSDFFSIRKIVRKTKTRVAVLKRYGLPFFMKDARKRSFFIAGLSGCIFFLIIMSRFLWAVDFEGNEQITADMLMRFLRQEGITYGMPLAKIDIERLEDDLRESFDQITWTSLRTEGTKLTVSIRENDLPDKKFQETEAKMWKYGADLSAVKTGKICQILTRSGVPIVKAGDMVKKGSVLVSGQIPVYNDDGTVKQWQYCVSDADIFLEYEQEIKIDQKFYYEYKNYTGREKKYSFLEIGGKKILLRRKETDFARYDEVTELDRIRLFPGIDLPVFRGKTTAREYLPVEAVYDENSAIKLLQKEFSKIVDGLEQKGVQIIQKDVRIIRKTDRMRLTGVLTLVQEAVVLTPADPAERLRISEDGEQ